MCVDDCKFVMIPLEDYFEKNKIPYELYTNPVAAI